jgi:hypothetical protein
MKNAVLVSVLIISFLGSKTPARAESFTAIAISKAQLKAVNKALNAKLDAHSKMSAEAILASLEKTLRANGDRLEKANPRFDRSSYDKFSEDYLTQMRSLGDAQSMLAYEKAQAQELAAAASYNFALTKWVRAENSFDDAEDNLICVLAGIVTVPLDLAMLPITIPMSIFSSFPEWNAERKREADGRRQAKLIRAELEKLEREKAAARKAEEKAAKDAAKKALKAQSPSNAN